MAPRDRAGPVHALVTATMTEELRARLEGLGADLRVTWASSLGRTALDQLEDAELEVVVGPFAPRTMRGTPALRWLQVDSAGVDHLVDDRPWDRGLVVTNASGVFAPAIGQYVLAAILRVLERVDARTALQQRHEWAAGADRESVAGLPARGRTVVVVGYGSSGREVARLVAQLGMRVIAVKGRPNERHDRGYRVPGTGDPDGVIPDRIVGPGDLSHAVGIADFVVLTIPLTERTRGLFDATLLGCMRPDGTLINVGRGSLVDEEALVTALEHRRIGSAVLDVVATEPLRPDSPLWNAPNLVVTPHLSGSEPSSSAILADLVAENLRRYLAGESLLNLVDGTRRY